MIFSKPIPFTEAIASQKVKKLMPTKATSAELEALGPDILARARFMAQVDHAGTVAKADSVIKQVLGMEGKPINPNQARADLGEYLQSIGYDPANPPEGFAPAKPGSLQDISSDARRNLVINTNTQMAHGYGDWKQGQNAAILDQWPCWELIRVRDRKERRNWKSRWVAAGGKLYGSTARMIARKDDPIWRNLGPFHLPYAPFDFGSGMGTRDVDRDTAEALGVIKPSTIVQPQEDTFNDSVRVALPKGSPDLVAEVIKAFDGTVLGAGSWLQFADDLGSDALAAAKASQAATGQQIMREAIDNQADAMNAMTRTDIDGPIDFRWGETGKHGYGVAHIIERRDADLIDTGSGPAGEEMAMKIPEIIAFGKVEAQGIHKIKLIRGEDIVVISDDLDGEPVNRWVLSAFEKKK